MGIARASLFAAVASRISNVCARAGSTAEPASSDDARALLCVCGQARASSIPHAASVARLSPSARSLCVLPGAPHSSCAACTRSAGGAAAIADRSELDQQLTQFDRLCLYGPRKTSASPLHVA
eukprot:4384870-Pleurochrysis_carterae.AAC.2